jgi:putative selenium metabolism protein SsnA
VSAIVQATLLTGGTLVEWDPPRVGPGDLILSGDRIAAPEARLGTTTAIDCSGCLIAPGNVVAHTHLYSALARGMPGPSAPPATFRQILERVWWRLDRALDAESIAVSAEVAAIEAVRTGTSCVIDHHESPSLIDGALDLIAGALERIGLRAVLAYGATDRHGAEGARAGLAESERFAKAHAREPLLRGMIALHAPFTCSDRTLEEASAAEARTLAGLHLHAAEGPDDQADAKTRFHGRLIGGLDVRGILSARTLLAHAVDIDRSEAELLDERRVFVAHQARSNMNNGVGYAKQLLALDRVALGTDGIDNDLFAELKAAFFRAREQAGPTSWPDPTRLVSRGHRLATERFGVPFGSLRPGAAADVVVLAYEPPTPLDSSSLASHLLFGMSSLHVRDVFVGGRAVLRGRKLVTADERAVMARARKAASALFQRMEAP